MEAAGAACVVEDRVGVDSAGDANEYKGVVAERREKAR